MTKKHLAVVPSSTMDGPPICPRRLGPHGMAMWAAVHAQYGIEDVGGVELLTLCCQALDRAEDCAEIIDREGASL